MPSKTALPALSIIVPILNEAETLPALFDMLCRQEQVAFELILADGGSTDGTQELIEELAAIAPFPCLIIRSGKGRARQLNAGARQAGNETLLFLHADCAFSDPFALRRGLDSLQAAVVRRGNGSVAGRFALRFDVPSERYGFGYYFYECKARLGRQEGIHGDQGFLLSRSFFAALGGFDEALELLEDNRFAEEARRGGEWVLLPAEILTSARRFEAEGLRERQILNALVMNFASIGWTEFFRAAPAVYRSQGRTRRLRLFPFFQAIRQLLKPLPLRECFDLWRATGSYVRGNAWQIPFAQDMRRAFKRGLAPGEGETPRLDLHDAWFDRLTDHSAGRLSTAMLVWIWFHLTYLFLRAKTSEGT